MREVDVDLLDQLVFGLLIFGDIDLNNALAPLETIRSLSYLESVSEDLLLEGNVLIVSLFSRTIAKTRKITDRLFPGTLSQRTLRGGSRKYPIISGLLVLGSAISKLDVSC